MGAPADPADIAKAKVLWETTDHPVDSIARQVDRSPPWIYRQARDGRWKSRPQRTATVIQGKPPRRGRFGTAWAQDQRQDVLRTEVEAYGDSLDDYRLLAKLGWVIFIEGQCFRCGNSLVTPRELRQKADRERRLRGLVSVSKR